MCGEILKVRKWCEGRMKEDIWNYGWMKKRIWLWWCERRQISSLVHMLHTWNWCAYILLRSNCEMLHEKIQTYSQWILREYKSEESGKWLVLILIWANSAPCQLPKKKLADFPPPKRGSKPLTQLLREVNNDLSSLKHIYCRGSVQEVPLKPALRSS